PDGALGIRRYFESPYQSGQKLTVADYYRWIFEHSVPGLPEAAAREGLDPLTYMRKYGAFLVDEGRYRGHEEHLPKSALEGTSTDQTGLVTRDGTALGIEIDGIVHAGFPTPSRRLEFFSSTLKQWKWPEYAIPTYIRSHVHRDDIDPS